MKEKVFYILDVFAEKKYTGNQLAVVRKAEGLSSDEMQQIAREINFSETTFILSDESRAGGFDVRIFTPREEVPFAGHPTLGTAFIIRNEILKGRVVELSLNLKVGSIPVRFNEAGYCWMQQKSPSFGRQHPPAVLADVLHLSVNDLDGRFPVQEVSTGLPFFIVPLKSLQALKQAQVDLAKYYTLIEQADAKGILVFSPETHESGNDLSARVFVDYYGVPEDPATGSGNGCLAGYLVKQRYFGSNSIDIRCEQGYEIGRPSLLLLQAKETEITIDISVGGKCILVGQGKLV